MEELDGIDRLIDWKAIEKLMAGIHAKKQGEQAWPPLLMFKTLLLQSWFGLSDTGLEKQLARDLLFRRFINLGLSEGVPDHSTIWRFRNTLTKQSLRASCWTRLTGSCRPKVYISRPAKSASSMPPSSKPNRAAPARMPKGENTQDSEAGYTVKIAANGKKTSTYGYKAHVNVDEDCFIKAVDLYPGQ